MATPIDVDTLKTHVDGKRFIIAILALVIYDIALTVGDSVSLFWLHKRWSTYKVLFFINRIVVVLEIITIVALSFVSFQSDHGCSVATWAEFGGSIIIIATVAFTLASRVYALWRGHHIILTIFFLVLSANICNYLFIYGHALYEGIPSLQTLPFTGCTFIIKPTILWVCFANTLLFEALSLGLIIYKAWPIARQRGIDTPFFSLLLEDGVAYYLSFTISKLFTVGSIYVPTTISMVILPAYPSVLIAALAINRLFIHLQSVMIRRPTGTEFTTAEYSKYGWDPSTSESSDGGNGPREIVTIGGTGPNGCIRVRRHQLDDDEVFSEGDFELYLAPTRHGSSIAQGPTEGSVGIDSNPRHVV